MLARHNKTLQFSIPSRAEVAAVLYFLRKAQKCIFAIKAPFCEENKGEFEGKIPSALGHPIGASGALLAHDFARKV